MKENMCKKITDYLKKKSNEFMSSLANLVYPTRCEKCGKSL